MNEFLQHLKDNAVVSSIFGTLIFILIGIIKGEKRLSRIISTIKYFSYIFKFNKLRSFASDLLFRKELVLPILDEMIGKFDATHIGIYTFHNGTVDINNKHLYKLTMIDERCRQYSMIKNMANIPLVIFSDIILDCVDSEYSYIKLDETNNVFLKESYSFLPFIHYVYHTIQWENGLPKFLISIATHNTIPEEKLKLIFNYRVILKKIINFEIDDNTYNNLYT